jgi:isoquinoline 1-oxidoreductase beta subunit
VHILRAGLNANGQVEGWQHRIHTQALSNAPAFLAGILGASGTRPPYKMRVGNPILRTLDLPVTTGFWRSVYLSQNIFAVESFVDELAALAGQDPFEFRLSMVNEERVRGVLELAAAKADWGKPLPAGRARGIACMADLGSFIAQVVELSVNADGSVRVHRVVSAVDCGVTVNPKTVEAQIQGGVVDGLSTAFKAEITIEGGRVQQSSFRDFEWYRMRDMPESIEVYIVPSTDAPGGIGEVGYPCVPPAVASAIFAATGKRLRKLPMRPADIMGA